MAIFEVLKKIGIIKKYEIKFDFIKEINYNYLGHFILPKNKREQIYDC